MLVRFSVLTPFRQTTRPLRYIGRIGYLAELEFGREGGKETITAIENRAYG